MRSTRIQLVVCLALFYAICETVALPFVAFSLGSNMVLPAAPLKAKIWGWTSSGNQAVTVTLNPGAQVIRATSSQTAPFGWTVSINSPNPSFTQYSITISSTGVSDVVFSTVLFGDVYPEA
eukprot:TRINITY_DN3297_c0_g1_i11.p3 TRINITY_DN3297_c0_g1~~TRINITY_DN3297_c0_g1_i11.p3  ORF type:complete len:121 (-),score=18.95 TRINITY_DN3297_c0_g1_i11:92-454(-)